ncbi:MAG: methyltransferase domain-containing protein [Acidimicrobiales bacterium]
MFVWDPGLYRRFEDHRTRPFLDLLARIPIVDAALVADLGCGPGHLAPALARRFPAAQLIGVDSSPGMIAAARQALTGESAARAQGSDLRDRLRFEVADARTWQPPAPLDVLISNATLHWIEGHVDLMGHWLTLVRPGGVLAFGVPANFNAPSHRSIRELLGATRWQDRIDPSVMESISVESPPRYLEALLGLGATVDVWESTYYQVLTGEDPVLQWLRGTALRPVLAALDPDEVPVFEAELAEKLRAAYPPGPHGTVFPFRRLFAVAERAH